MLYIPFKPRDIMLKSMCLLIVLCFPVVYLIYLIASLNNYRLYLSACAWLDPAESYIIIGLYSISLTVFPYRLGVSVSISISLSICLFSRLFGFIGLFALSMWMSAVLFAVLGLLMWCLSVPVFSQSFTSLSACLFDSLSVCLFINVYVSVSGTLHSI